MRVNSRLKDAMLEDLELDHWVRVQGVDNTFENTWSYGTHDLSIDDVYVKQIVVLLGGRQPVVFTCMANITEEIRALGSAAIKEALRLERRRVLDLVESVLSNVAAT